MPPVYYRRDYDSSGHEARMSDLMRMRSQAMTEAKLRSGQAWSQGVQQAGQAVGNAMSDLAKAPERAAQQRYDEARTADLEARVADRQRDADEQQKASEILGQALEPGEDGTVRINRAFLTKGFTDAGIADRLPEVLKGLDAADDRIRKMKAEQNEALAALGYSIAQSGNTPGAFSLATQYAVQNGAVSADKLQPYLDAAKQDPSKIGAITSALIGLSPEFSKLAKGKDPGTRAVTTRDAEGNETTRIVQDVAGQTFTSAPERAAAGTFEDYVDRLEGEQGRRLDRRELLQARNEWNAAGRAPASAGGGITPAQRATAERWRLSELRKLDAARADLDAPMSEVEYQQAKHDIEQSYRSQIGEPPLEDFLGVERSEPGTESIVARGEDVPDDAPSAVRADGLRPVEPGSPFGASPANAAPRPPTPKAPPKAAAPKVGDIVTVKGQRVRITAISPNGQFKGVPVS